MFTENIVLLDLKKKSKCTFCFTFTSLIKDLILICCPLYRDYHLNPLDTDLIEVVMS